MPETTTLPDPVPASAGIFFDPAAQAAGVDRSAAPAAPAGRRHLLGLEGLTRPELLELLESARAWRLRWRVSREPARVLPGVEVCNAFFEDSTRTRMSFELAERRLGMTPLSFGVAGSSQSKGESLLDTLRTLVAMGVDLVVMRHRSAGAPALAAAELPATVINAGDGAHEHPTQGLLDLLTLADAWGDTFEGRCLAIVGDVAHSRVARSVMFGLRTLGSRITLAGPATLMPREVESLGCERAASVEDALRGADAAMALRIQTERLEQGLLPSLAEYARGYRLDAARVDRMAPHAVVMHPGPMNRDVEIASGVADGPRSVVLRQVENGVAVRAAALEWCARQGAA